MVAASLAITGVRPLAAQVAPEAKQPTMLMLKTLKYGMIRAGNSMEEKFAIAKRAGFDGIELAAPGIDVAETRAAIAKTGLVVDGTVGASHWKIRHSSPDAETRAKALQDLKTAIEQTAAVGGHTALIVIGKGEDGPESEIIPRTIENIAKAIPVAARNGVVIAIENVWNQMLYDHDGSTHQTADRFVKYVDAFHSPWVGMQYDIGNHWQYGDPAEWIRTLGKRIVKLDIKGYSRVDKKFTAITEGDIDWPSVRKALVDIGFHGWCAAEVKGAMKKPFVISLKRFSGRLDDWIARPLE